MDDPLMELKLMEESYQQEINSRALLSQNVDLYATLEGKLENFVSLTMQSQAKLAPNQTKSTQLGESEAENQELVKAASE